MLASTSAADMSLPNLALTFIVRAVQQSPAVSSRPASNEQGTRASAQLASSQPMSHVDVKA